MFRRKSNDGSDDGQDDGVAPESLVAPAAKPVARPAQGTQPLSPPVLPNRVPTMPPRAGATDLGRPELPRRPADPGVPSPVPPAKAEAELRQLIVGREISLSGEIKACDRLVVEGSVESHLSNCRDIEIAETGLFKGSAAIDDAEISGRFEGTLTVRNRLFIRASGRVIGTVHYGQLEIECGGRVSGEIRAEPAEPGEIAHERASRGVTEVGATQLE
jgi:cytoskeletal protein CcmA (bactofilin family)